MGASAYIGRVGSLAVTLGVGTAIATGHGIAAADDTDTTSGASSPSDPTSTSDTGSTADTAANPGAAANPGSAPSDAAEPSKPGRGSQKPSRAASERVASGVVTAQTNTGKSNNKPPTEPTTPTEPTAKPVKPESVAKPVTKDATKNKKNSSPSAAADTPAESPKVAAKAVAAASEAQPAAAAKPGSEAPTATTTATSAKKSVTPSTLSSATVQRAAQPAAVAARSITVQTQPAPASNPLTVVTKLVTNVIGMVLGPTAGGNPATPVEPPMAWGLLAFARREFENLVSAITGGSTETPAATVQTTSLALTEADTVVTTLAAVPVSNPQLSPSTKAVQWVTGDYQIPNEPFIADTLKRFGVSGTDVGIMWDNGMVDDPSTPFDEHQVLMAFGDTFGLRSVPGEDWRFNSLMRSSDHILSDGIEVPDGEFGNGNWYGGMPLWDVPKGPPVRDYENYARRIINPESLPAGAQPGITLIPTAGISVPTPSTKYGVTQYVSFMSVTKWGSPGQWTTNFSAIAYSEDNGENWKVAPTSVRYNQPMSGNQNFQQAAFVRPGDGYVYSYGTPNGRQGSAYLSRVPEKDILDVTKYEYYSKGSAGGWFGIGATPAGWKKNNPSAATPIFGGEKGACGVANPGSQVSELSVQYNKQLKKYVMLYGDQSNNIVMRTSDTPQGTWSSAKVLIPQQPSGIYAPMMHPWSPSTLGTGNDLYWNLSYWSEYNVMLMKTDLTKV
jgi:Domain of unknown function (DUF4185)